jgi:prepilin-type N-terminal cleavage/methylation domain-containing protein
MLFGRTNLKSPTRRRRGLTLVEVLVAILVMGIGLISLLALFPLGAMSMAQSIKDNRMAQYAASAKAFANFRIRNTTGYYPTLPDPALITAFQYYHPTTTTPVDGQAEPVTTGPTYPVYVDPFGLQLQGTNPDMRVGTYPGATYPTCIQRINLSTITSTGTPAQIPRWFAGLDDMVFGPNGMPNPAGPNVIERNERYTWAFLCQESTYVPPGSSTAPQINVTAVVYDRRAPTLVNGNQISGENVYQGATYTQYSPIVTLTWSQTQQPEPPDIQPGTWILDATANTTNTSIAPFIHGYFYRVVGVSNPGHLGAGTIDYEIQTPAVASATSGLLVVMDGVSEVFSFGLN